MVNSIQTKFNSEARSETHHLRSNLLEEISWIGRTELDLSSTMQLSQFRPCSALDLVTRVKVTSESQQCPV